MPQITTLSPNPIAQRTSTAKKSDILDILSGKSTGRSEKRVSKEVSAISAAVPMNIFEVSVMRGDEKRATVFLERVREVLEKEPGRLVL